MNNKQEPEDMRNVRIAICSECNTTQTAKYIESSPFARAGKTIPCKFCTGKVIWVTLNDRDNAIKQENRQRGI